MEIIGNHPYSELFPLMSEVELTELTDSIKKIGLLNPITLLDGKVIDGRNRMLACSRAAVEPVFSEWYGEGSPLDWVLAQNSTRRSLSQSQKAAIAVEAAKIWFADDVAGDKRVRIADLLGVGRHYLTDALRIEKKDIGLLAQVRAGGISVPSAIRQIEWRENGGKVSEKEWTVAKVATSLMRYLPYDLLRDACMLAISRKPEDTEVISKLFSRVEGEIYGRAEKTDLFG